jgi:hypothetical protein
MVAFLIGGLYGGLFIIDISTFPLISTIKGDD